MTIPDDIAGWLQRHLSILCEDDLSIGHFASGQIELGSGRHPFPLATERGRNLPRRYMQSDRGLQIY